MPDPKPRGLGLIADFINVSGPSRVTVMRQHISWVDTPSAFGPKGYGPAESAIVRALEGNADPKPLLDRMVNRATDSHRRHYEQLAAGAERFITTKRMTTVPVSAAMWHFERLHVKINHVVGLEDRKGHRFACFLYLKEPVLSQNTVDVVTRLIEVEIEHVLPGATAVALDVRRAKLMKRHSRRRATDLDMLLRSEARYYVDLWDEVQGSAAA